MAYYNYCPKCDKLVIEEKSLCVNCKRRIVKVSGNTEVATGIVVILALFMVLGMIIVPILIQEWWGIIGGILFFIVLFAFALSIGVRSTNRVAEEARVSFEKHREKYEKGEKLDLRVRKIVVKKPPWNVRHIKFLYRSTILFGSLIPIIVMIIWYFRTLTFCASFTMTSLIIISLFSYLAYKPASRFVSIIEALELSSEDYSFPKWRTMKVDSQRFGMFFVFYDSRYKLWVTTGKHVDRERKRNYIIWKKPRPIKRFLGREDRLPDYLSASRLRGIKSLQAIRFEKLKHGNRIAAILNDKWFYSEDRDIHEALEILWEIEARI